MAIYFLNLRTFGRSNGSSAVSAAAYRAGERIRDERTGRTYDHSDRHDVLHKEIMLPDQFSADKMSWAQDRGNLWNRAESAEVRANARTAREYLVSLPSELSPQARINLVTAFSRELVERYQFALDIAIHAPRDFPGSDPRNFHAHLLATTREVALDGLGAKTALEWSDTARRRRGMGPGIGELLHVRERWAVAANSALEQAQIDARIDHRTLQAQGIEREPLHIPHAAFEAERRGYYSAVAERIRAEHQARVEARLARAAQQEKPAVVPKNTQELAKESALMWAARYGRTQEAQPKSPDELAKEAALSWARYREAQKDAPVHGREQTEPARTAAKHARDSDRSL